MKLDLTACRSRLEEAIARSGLVNKERLTLQAMDTVAVLKDQNNLRDASSAVFASCVQGVKQQLVCSQLSGSA